MPRLQDIKLPLYSIIFGKQMAYAAVTRLTKVVVLLLVIGGVNAESQSDTASIECEKAEFSYEQGDADTALIHLKRCQQAMPEYLPALALLGKIQSRQKAYPQAVITFNDAIKRGADESLFAREWADALLAVREYEVIKDFAGYVAFPDSQKAYWLLARAESCMALQEETCARESYNLRGEIADDIEQPLGLAGIAIKTRNWKAANRHLQQARKFNDTDIRVWLAMAQVSQGQGKIEQALDYAALAFQINPEHPLVLRIMADLYLAANDDAQALSTVDAILKQSPQDPYALLVSNSLTSNTERALQLQAVKNQIEKLRASLTEPSDELMYLQGLIAYQEGALETAITQFEHLYKEKAYFPQTIVLLAKTQVQLGQRAEAIKVLEANQDLLLTEAPTAYALLIELFIEQGTVFKALGSWQTFISTYPKRIDAQLLEVKILLARGLLDRGAEKLTVLQQRYPDSTEIQTVYAVVMARANQPERALMAVKQLLGAEPQSAYLLNFKGALHLMLHQYVDAATALDEALRLSPDLTPAKINRIWLTYQQGETERAVNEARELSSRLPRDLAVGQLYAGLLLSSGQSGQAMNQYLRLMQLDDTQQSVIEALVTLRLQNNNLAAAIQGLSRLIELEYNTVQNLLRRAQLSIALGEVKKAEIDIKKAALLANNDPLLLVAAANAALQAGNSRLAIQSLHRARELMPDDLLAGLKLAEIFLNENQSSEAEVVLKQLVKAHANQVDVWLLKGRLAEQQGDLNNAKRHYYKALSLNGDYDLIYAKLYTLTQYGVGSDEFEKILIAKVSKQPNVIFTRNLLAQLYYYQLRFESAAKHYTYLYENLLPEDKKPAFARRLAQTYFHFNTAKGIEYTKIALQSAPDDPYVKSLAGWSLTLQNRPAEAVKLLREAYTLDGNNPDTAYFLAYTLAQLELNSEAQQVVSQLINKQRGFAYEKEAQALVARLKNAS
ncbi:tetratricopeptide repeat protein [Aestuariibacter sp. GS-14]|uniref:tetratricopeptide repeat protein n=1 Tax=Aestuariibacter sp. GS-14 TaxID=2590670 RepID=UPI0015E87705|nr:tetratricopeptide repeat protein [Aestuariibacter sp. GS-14]